MQFIGVLKRVVPFFLTFAAGLFIASFFVSIPSLEAVKRDRSGKWGRYQQMKRENRELRRENCRMKKELDAMREASSAGHGIGMGHGSGWASGSGWSEIEASVPPPPTAPVAPPPPAPVREMKMKTVTVK